MAVKPNILFFFTDDQRFDTLSCLGNPVIQTPNLDALCARGTVFTHAHIPGGTCGAVCMPSRAMLLTGRTLFHIQGEGQAIPDDHVLLGEHLRNQGYATFGTGKWHNGRRAYWRSFTHGDEIFFGGMEDHWNVPVYHFDPTGAYDIQRPIVRDPYHNNSVDYRSCDHVEAGVHSTDLFVDAGNRFLEQHDTRQPFFMYISLMAPHDPRTMPDRFLKMYDPQTTRLPENFLAQHPFDTGELRGRDEMLAAIPRQPEEIRRHLAEYYAMISHLDAAFGRLIEGLKQTGQFENTIVVFAGDNGLALGQHGLMGKQNLYDHSVRVPLVFAGPGIAPGKRSAELTYLLDIYPTLCDLAGIDVPGSVEGHSLAESLHGSASTGREMLYLAYARWIRGVSDGYWKLIEYAGGNSQLFDLQNDPFEMRNLALDKTESGRLDHMRQELARLGSEWDDASHPTGEAFWSSRVDLRGES